MLFLGLDRLLQGKGHSQSAGDVDRSRTEAIFLAPPRVLGEELHRLFANQAAIPFQAAEFMGGVDNLKYFQGRLIRFDDFIGDSYALNEISQELMKGVYI